MPQKILWSCHKRFRGTKSDLSLVLWFYNPLRIKNFYCLAVNGGFIFLWSVPQTSLTPLQCNIHPAHKVTSPPQLQMKKKLDLNQLHLTLQLQNPKSKTTLHITLTQSIRICCSSTTFSMCLRYICTFVQRDFRVLHLYNLKSFSLL